MNPIHLDDLGRRALDKAYARLMAQVDAGTLSGTAASTKYAALSAAARKQRDAVELRQFLGRAGINRDALLADTRTKLAVLDVTLAGIAEPLS